MALPAAAWRDIGTVARFETRRALGSSRGVFVLLLYLAGSLLMGAFYVTVVRTLEDQAMALTKSDDGGSDDSSGADAGSGADASKHHSGKATDITQSDAYQHMIERFTDGDKAKAELWGHTPPIVLISFWLSLAFIPFLVMVTAHDVLARDNELRTVRFVRPRAAAISFVLGKFLAQALLIFVVTVVSGIALYGVAATRLESFPLAYGALMFLDFWGRIFIYEIGFLGVMFILSGASKTSFSALLGSGLTLFVLWLLQFFSYFKDGEELRPIGYLSYLSPFMHKNGLWMPASKPLAYALLAYLGFAVFGIVVSIVTLDRREI